MAMSTAAFDTKLTQLLGVKVPLVCPPMANGGGGALAASVSRAGGFGFIGSAYKSAPEIIRELDVAQGLPVGVGFNTWTLVNSNTATQVLNAALCREVAALWFPWSHGGAAGWVKRMNRHNEAAETNIRIFVQVENFGEAVDALRAGVDFIVVGGCESLTYGVPNAAPVNNLLQEVLTFVRGRAPVLAAGGFTNRLQLASVLHAGAAGMVVSTGFLTAQESLFSDTTKLALIRTSSEDLVRPTYDELRSTIQGWPKGNNDRPVLTALVRRLAAGRPPEETKDEFAKAARAGKLDRLLASIGTDVKETYYIASAKDMVQRIREDAAYTLETSNFPQHAV